jgi:hypothetical protein
MSASTTSRSSEGIGRLTWCYVRELIAEGTFWALAVPNTRSTAFRARSSPEGIRWVYVRSVNPGSLCPRYSARVRMSTPPPSLVQQQQPQGDELATAAGYRIAHRSSFRLGCPRQAGAGTIFTHLPWGGSLSPGARLGNRGQASQPETAGQLECPRSPTPRQATGQRSRPPLPRSAHPADTAGLSYSNFEKPSTRVSRNSVARLSSHIMPLHRARHRSLYRRGPVYRIGVEPLLLANLAMTHLFTEGVLDVGRSADVRRRDLLRSLLQEAAPYDGRVSVLLAVPNVVMITVESGHHRFTRRRSRTDIR